MIKRFHPIVVLFCILVTFGAENYLTAQAAKKVGPEAIWSPVTDTIQMIHKQCDSSTDFSACFVSFLQKSGATPQAIQFVNMTDNTGYLRDFRHVGPVDVAYVNFPFRANENQGCYLVNGTPSPIDIDNLQALPQSELNSNPAYQQLSKQYPNISLWPGDRNGMIYPTVENLPNGGKRFIVNYIFRDQCHACAVIGSGSFGFEFDASGKLQGIHLVRVQAKAETGAKFSDPNQPVQLGSGQSFTIVLNSNRTTGYQWQLAKPLDASILKQVNNVYEAPQKSLPGAGGKELWTFIAVGKGKTTIDFQYVRPWEKNTPGATTSSFEVVVE